MRYPHEIFMTRNNLLRRPQIGVVAGINTVLISHVVFVGLYSNRWEGQPASQSVTHLYVMKANAIPTRLTELPRTTPKATSPFCSSQIDPMSETLLLVPVVRMVAGGNPCKWPAYKVSICKQVAGKEKGEIVIISTEHVTAVIYSQGFPGSDFHLISSCVQPLVRPMKYLL